MKTPTPYERKLQKLLNDIQIALSGGVEVYEENYTVDVRKRALKADRALQALLNELKNGER